MRIYTMPRHMRVHDIVHITVRDEHHRTVIRIYRRLRESGINSNWARWHVVDLIGVGMYDARYSFEESK
jgi:hypothetical protein